MKRRLGILIILGLSCSLSCLAQNAHPSTFTHLDKIIVVVNREIITQSQFNQELEQKKKLLTQTNATPPSNLELRKQVLDGLIAKNLQMQLCKARGMTVTDAEVDKTIENIAKSNKITQGQLKEVVEQSGVNFKEYTSHMREQILLQKLQQEEVAKTVGFSPEDVKIFMRENKEKLNGGYNAFYLVDILLPVADTAEKVQMANAKKDANEIVRQLQQGKSVEEVLKKYPLAENNPLGWRSLAQLPSLFQSKAASMTIKSVNGPISAPNGLHILQLIDAKGENPKLSEKEIKNLAFQYKVSKAVQSWVEKLRKDSYVKIVN